MPIKYVLHPGPVRSRYDQQWHIITSSQLMRLYGVPASECIRAPITTSEWTRYQDPEGAIHLFPRDLPEQYRVIPDYNSFEQAGIRARMREQARL